MTKSIRIFFLLLIPFFLTSCVDYVQSISYKNGKYQMYYKVTLSKVLFAMAEQDPEEIFEGFDNEALGDLPKNVIVKKVNTDLEVGAEFSLLIDPRTNDEQEKSFLPKISGNKCYIPFLLGSEDSSLADSMSSENSDSQAIAEAIMSSAKCRVLISKNIIPQIETAYFEGRGGQNYSIALFDYGDLYCLEIPFIILMNKGNQKLDRIVVIKK
mgnify:FL=1